MAEDWAAVAADVAQGIAEAGMPAVLRRMVPGDGPPHNPGPPTAADYACTVVVTEYDLREIDGTMIRATDKKVLIAADLETEPRIDDALVIGGKVYSLVPPLSPTAPAGTVVMWTATARA